MGNLPHYILITRTKFTGMLNAKLSVICQKEIHICFFDLNEAATLLIIDSFERNSFHKKLVVKHYLVLLPKTSDILVKSHIE